MTQGENLRMREMRKEERRTELRNPASKNLDRMKAADIVRLMNREDAKVAAAVKKQLPFVARAVDQVVDAIRNGGRLIYVGAGSSGRMAVLDATECQPTFGISAKEVTWLIAGGRKAVTGAVEGAEDSEENAERDLRTAKLSRKDVVVGIAASGTTPYALGALRYAKKIGARRVAITSNGNMAIAGLAEIVIAPNTGPEVLTGSTRLKAGTAQKMVLNMLSTAVMARLGHVYENLMIDVVLTNKKISRRAVLILAEASGKPVQAAEHALRAAGHNLRIGLVMLKLGLSAAEAKRRIDGYNGDLRRALGEARNR